MGKLALIAVAGVALLALTVVSVITATFTNTLNVLEPIMPSLSVYNSEEVAKTVFESIMPTLSTYLSKETTITWLKPIAPVLTVSKSAEKATTIAVPIAPTFLIGRLVGNLSTPYTNATVATLSHIEGNFPIVNRTVVLDVPNTTYIQKTTNITVKIVDPTTGEVDKTFTGWVRVTVDDSSPIDAYIADGIGTITVTFSSTGYHSVKVSLLNGAGGWGSNGSVSGWNPDDVPEYIVAPSNVTVKATTETTLIPTKIVLTMFQYQWMNNTHVTITLKGYVVDATGERVPGGTIKISVLKKSWVNAGVSSVDKNGEFMWEGTVDPPTSAWLNLTYVPNSTIYLSSSKQLPLFEAQAVGRALGGKASPTQPYLAVAWLAPALASATALACLLRKRGKEGRA